jgi:hypothetical protein
MAEKPVLNKQGQDCRLIAQIAAPDGTEIQSLHLPAKKGLEDKFGRVLKLKTITEHEFFQYSQSDPHPTRGYLNLNPGELMYHLVRMN